MPLQDLTPQLRTRLNRMEKVVGWFITAALALAAVGFAYFLYRTAELRGWFEVEAPFYTYADTGEGLKVGDPVKLMGFPIGHLTEISPMPPRGKGSEHNVRIGFVVVGTNYSYIWTGNSRAKFISPQLIGAKALDISKGTNGYTVYVNFPVKEMTLEEIKASPHSDKLRLGQEIFQGTNVARRPWTTNLESLSTLGVTKAWILDTTKRSKNIDSVWNDVASHYETLTSTNVYVLPPDSEPEIMDRVNAIVAQVEAALPNFLALTNQIAATLANATLLTSNLNAVAASVRPAVGDIAVITANLRDPHGSLGEWLIPTNINQQLAATLLNANGTITTANATITNVDTNLVVVFDGVGEALFNLADITSNLNHQVQVNSNMLSQISSIIVDSDSFMEGLKHHWLLRSAFKPAKTNTPPTTPAKAPSRK
jgi:MlaD protein